MTDLPSSFQNIELIVLDMDGVITSEQAYWDAAGLTVRELLESPAYLGLSPSDYSPIADLFYQKLAKGNRNQWRKYLPTPLIMHSKMRGVNNNWDIAYLTFGLYWSSFVSSVLPLFLEKNTQISGGNAEASGESHTDAYSSRSWEVLQNALSPVWDHLVQSAGNGFSQEFLRAQDLHLWGDYFRQIGRTVSPIPNIELRVIDDFHPDLRGLQLLEALNGITQGKLNRRVNLFGRETQLWEECRDIFQSWYLGEELYQKTYNRPLYYHPKPGLIYNEEPLMGREPTKAALSGLRRAGYRLAIATGRPRMEIRTPLLQWGLLHLFEQNRIVTNDEVEDAEARMAPGEKIHLSKPHPFVFGKAVYPDAADDELIHMGSSPIPDAHRILVIGDTQADIWAAQKMGCPVAALLSGAVGLSGRRQLEEAQPDFICGNILELSEKLVQMRVKTNYTL